MEGRVRLAGAKGPEGGELEPPAWQRPTVGTLAKLSVLLGQRPNEISRMRGSEVDLRGRLWIIPGARRKKHHAHAVPLAPLAVKTIKVHLASAPKHPTDPDRVFRIDPVNHGRWWFPFREACKATGCGHFTRRDLRRTLATGCGRIGVSRQTISLILGHASIPGAAPVTAGYDWADRQEEVRAALERWALHVQKVVR